MLVKYKNDLLVEIEELNSFYQTVQTLSFWYKLLFLFTGKISGRNIMTNLTWQEREKR